MWFGNISYVLLLLLMLCDVWYELEYWHRWYFDKNSFSYIQQISICHHIICTWKWTITKELQVNWYIMYISQTKENEILSIYWSKMPKYIMTVIGSTCAWIPLNKCFSQWFLRCGNEWAIAHTFLSVAAFFIMSDSPIHVATNLGL